MDYSPFAELYDLDWDHRSREDVAFFVEEALESGGPVLELGCGTGRVLVPTARAGLDITGLDLAAGMLARCRKALQQEGLQAELVQGDMRNFSLPRRFRTVTIPFRPFQHLVTVEEQLACLHCIARHLEPGGTLLLDLFNPSLEALLDPRRRQEQQDGPLFDLPDGRQAARYVQIVDYDPVAQVQQVRLRYRMWGGEGEESEVVHDFPMRHLFRFEAEHLLARAGFEVQALYGDYDRRPVGYPGELIFRARRTS